MHPFRDDRRSKSIEEREEEYQRVRERIFAHDVSSCFNCLFSAVLPQTVSWQDSGSWSQGQIERQHTRGVSGRGPGSGKWRKSSQELCVFLGSDLRGNRRVILVSKMDPKFAARLPDLKNCLHIHISLQTANYCLFNPNVVQKKRHIKKKENL